MTLKSINNQCHGIKNLSRAVNNSRPVRRIDFFLKFVLYLLAYMFCDAFYKLKKPQNDFNTTHNK